MPSIYEQYCPVARALEIVGERWTLLLVRELMLGPRRFSDLVAGLPGISSNVLATRLRDLEESGIITKRELPPPAASTVYELVEDAGLAGVLVAMTQWGMTLLGSPRPGDEIRGRWLVLGLAATATVPDTSDSSFELRIDDDVLELRVEAGHVHARQGTASKPDAVIVCDTAAFAAITFGDLDLDRAITRRQLQIDGDVAAGRALLESLHAPIKGARFGRSSVSSRR